MVNAKQLIEKIILNGTPAEQKELFGFDRRTNRADVVKKFRLFARGKYPRFFPCRDASFHNEMILNMINSYWGEFPSTSKTNFLNIASRGLAKTTWAKLFVVFVVMNDKDLSRKYLKVLTRDGKNSKQVVTDVYNLMLEVQDIYGDMFEKEGDKKREETMSSFTMKDGRKLSAGTVGQTQRGHVQDAYRPDWIWFDDVEDSESITSIVITEAIINKIEEAINGLAKGGSYLVTANYITDQGVIEYIRQKPSVYTQITPIADLDFNPTWPERDTQEDILAIKENVKDFWGDYMCDPQRSENKFFDIARIEDDMRQAKQPIKTSGEVLYWASYLPHHRYGMGSDHSDGIGLDANAMAIFDFTTGELVARYCNNKIAPDLAAHEFMRVGAEFGNCIYAPEVNNKCGGVVIATVKDNDYPNVYSQIQIDYKKNKRTKKLGWATNAKSKRNMLHDFKKDYNDGHIKIYDVEVLKEMKAYTNYDLDDETVGLISRHFDLLMAVVIAWQMSKHAKIGEPVRSNPMQSKYNQPSINNLIKKLKL